MSDHLGGGHHGQHQRRQHQVAQGVMQRRFPPGSSLSSTSTMAIPVMEGDVVEQADLAGRGQPAEIQEKNITISRASQKTGTA